MDLVLTNVEYFASDALTHFTSNKSRQAAKQVSSLVLFIRHKETIQNIHHSIISLNSDRQSFIFKTSLPIKPKHQSF